MLDTLNRYGHGFIAVPTILACRDVGLFESLADHPQSDTSLAGHLGANSGYLNAALRLLQSLGWIARDEKGEFHALVEPELVHQIPQDVLEWWSFPLDSFLARNETENSIIPWLNRCQSRWGVSDDFTAQLLDGAFVVPVLTSLHAKGLLPFIDGRPSPAWRSLDPRVQRELEQLFLYLEWAHEVDGGFRLTDLGQFLTDRALIVGTLAAYTPMLSQMLVLLKGDPTTVFGRDEEGHERHVERTLNVVASGFQHEKYFSDVRDIIVSIFDRQPLESQPKFVADMGCGDGTFLKQLFDVVVSNTARGRRLEQQPLQMIGADYNEKALAATEQTLQEIPHVVVKGDIGDPEQLMSSLKQLVGANSDDVLHVRSFLDHDRPLLPPKNTKGLERRSDCPYPGVYIDESGEAISAALVVQSLVEHLERWSDVITDQGMVVLEVHSVDPDVTRDFLDESESLHFDAYHAYSGQYLVNADLFMVCASEVGLFAKTDFFRRYPKTLPFCRITLSWFEKRPYTIRHMNRGDLNAVGDLLASCQNGNGDSSTDWLLAAISSYPLSNYVVEVDDRLVGAAFCESVDNSLICIKRLIHSDYQTGSLPGEFQQFLEQQASLMAGIEDFKRSEDAVVTAESKSSVAPSEKQDIPELVDSTINRLMEDNGKTYSTEKTFYELGLDSLDHMEMSTQLTKELGIKLDSSVLVDHDTPQKLTSFLRKRTGKGRRGIRSLLGRRSG